MGPLAWVIHDGEVYEAESSRLIVKCSSPRATLTRGILYSMLILNERLRIPLWEIHFQFARSSGPGGQNVNKVSSKAVLRWNMAASPSVPEDVKRRISEHLSRFSGITLANKREHREKKRQRRWVEGRVFSVDRFDLQKIDSQSIQTCMLIFAFP